MARAYGILNIPETRDQQDRNMASCLVYLIVSEVERERYSSVLSVVLVVSEEERKKTHRS